METLKEGYDYIFAEDDSSSTAAVVLTRGPYSGVAYAYGEVQVKEQDGHAVLKYDYNVLKNPKDVAIDESFKNHIGDVLISIIENNDYTIGEKPNDTN
jgi:hypothetical protein